MTFSTKDNISWLADVQHVQKEIREKSDFGKVVSKQNGVIKFDYKTESYEVTQWVHPAQKYAAWLAIAKDASYTITWIDMFCDGIRRW